MKEHKAFSSSGDRARFACDGEVLKADTWYKLRNGEFVEKK